VGKRFSHSASERRNYQTRVTRDEKDGLLRDIDHYDQLPPRGFGH